MKRTQLRVGESYIVAPPLVRLDSEHRSRFARRVVLVDTNPWEYGPGGVPQPADKGIGVLVVERAPDGEATKRVLPIGQFRMTAKEYETMRKGLARKEEAVVKHLTVRQSRFEDACTAAGMDVRLFGQHDGDTALGRDGRHWFEPRRLVVGMSLDTFISLASGVSPSKRSA